MKPDVLIFYAGQLLAEFTYDQWKGGNKILNWTPETYNGAYLCMVTRGTYRYFGYQQGWYRPDLTPIRLEDVPKELLMLKLLYST